RHVQLAAAHARRERRREAHHGFAAGDEIHQRTLPRAATFQLPSTRPSRPYQTSSCRLTVGHTWLGTTQPLSPVLPPWPSTYPCSSFSLRIVQERPMKWP